MGTERGSDLAMAWLSPKDKTRGRIIPRKAENEDVTIKLLKPDQAEPNGFDN
jgi:hypothetical protein